MGQIFGRLRDRRSIVVSVVAWSVIAVASTAETYLYAQRAGSAVSFATIFAGQLPGWAVWAAATAPIVALSRRFTLAFPPRPSAVAVHAACVATALAFTVVYTFASRAFPWGPPLGPLLTEMWHHLLGWGPFLLVAYAGVAGFGHALAYAADARREQAEKAALAIQLADAQLGALRMQLQPHFLFNTLNSVAMLVRSDDHARAVEMIALLGDVLRSLLQRSRALEAPLSSELAFLRDYLEIEQLRFGERLQVRWSVGESAQNALIPPLILQPLVENALRHGLWPCAEGGELAIVARRAGEHLELEVTDRGVGLAADYARKPASGIGLSNVRARLDRMYGGEATFDVSNGTDRGVCVRMRLPFRVEPRFATGPEATGPEAGGV